MPGVHTPTVGRDLCPESAAFSAKLRLFADPHGGSAIEARGLTKDYGDKRPSGAIFLGYCVLTIAIAAVLLVRRDT